MAKTMMSIQMDFQKAREEAGRLEDIAGEIRKLATGDMENCFGSISNGWQGESSKAYIKKGRRAGENLKNLARELEQTAGEIRRRAQAIYQAEQAALAMAEQRNYRG